MLTTSTKQARGEGRPTDAPQRRAPSTPDVMGKLRRLLQAVGPEERSTFAAALEAQPDEAGTAPGFTSGATGPSGAGRAGSVDNLRLQFDRRREIEQQSMTAAEVAGVLGVTRQAVNDAIGNGALIALRSGRAWRIPVWQLEADRDAPVLPGLAELARAFPGGPVALSRWVVRASPSLGGRSPRELLVDGDVDAVLGAAAALTSTGW